MTETCERKCKVAYNSHGETRRRQRQQAWGDGAGPWERAGAAASPRARAAGAAPEDAPPPRAARTRQPHPPPHRPRRRHRPRPPRSRCGMPQRRAPGARARAQRPPGRPGAGRGRGSCPRRPCPRRSRRRSARSASRLCRAPRDRRARTPRSSPPARGVRGSRRRGQTRLQSSKTRNPCLIAIKRHSLDDAEQGRAAADLERESAGPAVVPVLLREGVRGARVRAHLARQPPLVLLRLRRPCARRVQHRYGTQRGRTDPCGVLQGRGHRAPSFILCGVIADSLCAPRPSSSWRSSRSSSSSSSSDALSPWCVQLVRVEGRGVST